MNPWRHLFTNLLTACAKGVLIMVKTIDGNRWSVFLPSFEVVASDHLSLGGYDLQYDELLSIDLPEVLTAGTQKIANDIDLCFDIVANTPGFLVERSEAKYAPFSGQYLHVTRRAA